MTPAGGGQLRAAAHRQRLHRHPQRFEFAGSAGDVCGMAASIGFYFPQHTGVDRRDRAHGHRAGGGGVKLGLDQSKLATIFTRPGSTTVIVILLAFLVVSTLFGLLILPLRCWWQAYLLRYLVARVRAGPVLFATALSTRHMWGFMVVNYPDRGDDPGAGLAVGDAPAPCA